MKNITYPMSKAAYFLGVSRQQAYNRKASEEWAVDRDSEVPSNTIRISRDLELAKLRGRISELEELEIQQDISDNKAVRDNE